MVDAQVLATWLTPTSLFILLNIVLATIFLNHNSKNNNKNRHDTAVSATATHSQSHPQLTRAPSLFTRVASFNFSHYYHSEDSHVASQPDATATSAAVTTIPPVVDTIARAPSLLHRVASFKFGWTHPLQQADGEGKKEEAREMVSESHVRREKVEEQQEVKVVTKNKKVVRKKKVQKEVVDDVANVEEKTTAFKKEDEEVDSKADDFINKFKHQLKLQRLESLLRYRNNNA